MVSKDEATAPARMSLVRRAGRLVALIGLAAPVACATPGTRLPPALAPADAAPRGGFVTVSPGVRVHYLDWGGRGEPVLLVPGLYGTAEIYSEFAPRLTDRFRVLALTRRGHGSSDEPETGYEPDSLVEDTRAFLDSLRISRAHLVGHSLAGVELTAFAGRYPERVLKLVYLDAAYDRQRAGRLPSNPVTAPGPSPSDLASPEAYLAFYRQHPYWAPVWSAPVEAQLRASLVPGPDGLLRVKPSAAVLGMIRRGLFADAPRYELVKAPVLSIYVLSDTLPALPPAVPPALRDSAIARHRMHVLPYERASSDQLRRALPASRIIELRDTHHHLFVQRRDEVVRMVREFLLRQ